MQTDQPLVSVVIPAFNAAPFIERAITSALRQDYQNLEVIVVDDGSEDDTAEIAGAIGDPRIEVFRLEENVGVCGATNRGIREARGDYIAFLDADDEWSQHKLSVQMQKIRENDNYTFVTTGIVESYPDGSTIVDRGRLLDSNAFDDQTCKNMVDTDNDNMVEGRYAWKTLLYRSYIAKPAVLARKDRLLELGGFDESLKVAEDQDVWIRLAMAGEVGCIVENLVLVHKNPGSLMNRYPLGQYEYLLPMIEGHIEANRSRLTRREIRTILARLYHKVGIVLCENGRRGQGLNLLLRGMLLGYSVRESARLLLVHSLPASLLAAYRNRKASTRT